MNLYDKPVMAEIPEPGKRTKLQGRLAVLQPAKRDVTDQLWRSFVGGLTNDQVAVLIDCNDKLAAARRAVTDAQQNLNTFVDAVYTAVACRS